MTSGYGKIEATHGLCGVGEATDTGRYWGPGPGTGLSFTSRSKKDQEHTYADREGGSREMVTFHLLLEPSLLKTSQLPPLPPQQLGGWVTLILFYIFLKNIKKVLTHPLGPGLLPGSVSHFERTEWMLISRHSLTIPRGLPAAGWLPRGDALPSASRGVRGQDGRPGLVSCDLGSAGIFTAA